VNGATLILILILMGGAIAYAGDKIGMHVGRKRLSLFGLRPKYTSIIITLITGTLIAAATIGVLTFVSADIRSALFQMKEIKAELATTKSALSQSESRLKDVSSQVGQLQDKMGELVEQISVKTREYNELVSSYDKLKGDYAELDSNYQSLTKGYSRLKEEYGELSEAYDLLCANYGELNDDFRTLENQYKALDAEYQGLSSDYKDLEGRYSELDGSYKELEGKYSSLTSSYKDLTSTYETLNDEYQKLTQDYALLQSELVDVSSERDRAKAELVKLEEDKKSLSLELASTENALVAARAAQVELNQQIKDLEEERTALEEEVLRLKKEVESVKAEAEGWRAGFEGLLKSDIVYRADEIILSSVIDANKPVEEVRREMVNFMTRANTLAFQRGARISGDDVNAIWWLEQDVSEAYRKLEKEIKGKAVVRLLSALNTVRGEPVHAYFQVIPDGKVFNKGQVILKKTIDGKASPEAIQNELFSLLAEVNSIAIKKGMFSDELGTVGRVVGATEFHNTITQIRTAQAPVEVSVVAVNETWRSGELKIEFKVDYLLIN
jgi:uncharacterized protein (DUF3084 family)